MGNPGKVVATYFERLRAVPIDRVIRALLADRITKESQTKIHLDCPRHASASRMSLSADLHKGVFYCFGCRMGGDAVGFVEFVKHGVVTKGRPMSSGRREAVDIVAVIAGLPPFSSLTLDRNAQCVEEGDARDEEVYAALTDLAQIQCARLLEDDEVLAFCRDTWGLTTEAIESFQIGLSHEDDFQYLRDRGHDERTIRSTGAFSGPDRSGANVVFFKRRITIPYHSRGRVVYMIGRRSPQTPNLDWEKAKYKKLPVYDETTNNHVSRAISNRVLFGESILDSHPRRVLIVEGIVDAVIAQHAGFPTISPGTTSIAKEDFARITRKLKDANVAEVVVAFDEEISGAGLSGALQLAQRLRRENIQCRVASIPPRERQLAAREDLAKALGPEGWAELLAAEPAERAKILKTKKESDPAIGARLESLLSSAKIDVAEWFRLGGTAEEFGKIVDSAKEAIEFAIERLRTRDDPKRQIEEMRPLLLAVSSFGKAEQDALLQRIKAKTDITMTSLRSEMSAAKRAVKTDPAARRESVPTVTASEPETCAAIIERAKLAAASERIPLEWGEVARSVYAWIVDNGGRFFRTPDGEPYLFMENELFPLSTASARGRERTLGFLFRTTGVVATSSGGRQLFPTLAHLAADRGDLREVTTWCAWNAENHTLYVDLANERNEVAKVSADGVELVSNGTDSVILRSDRRRFRPISYDPDGGDDAIAFLDDAIGKHLACDLHGRRIAVLWTASLPLIPLLDCRPMLRSQGPSGSGKSSITKRITMFCFGEPQDECASVAALHAQAAATPLVALDNLETRDASDELINFVLGMVTGASRSKRARNSDSDVVQERSMALAVSNGIESFAPDRIEAVNRTFSIACDVKFHKEPMLERESLEETRRSRDRGFSILLRHTSKFLAAMRDGKFARLYASLSLRLGEHPKKRCNHFLAAMLMHERIVSGRLDEAGLEVSADEPFLQLVKYLNSNSDVAEREADPTLLALEAVFFDLADSAGRHDLLQRAQLEIEDPSTIVRARAGQLFIAMSFSASRRGLKLPFRHPNQVSVRLRSAKATLSAMGIEFVEEKDRHAGVPVFTLVRNHERAIP